jgi:hypothetical protein
MFPRRCKGKAATTTLAAVFFRSSRAQVPVMTNDQQFPEDDRTRISPGARPHQPDEATLRSVRPTAETDRTRILPGMNHGGQAPVPPAGPGPDSSPRPPFAQADADATVFRSGPAGPARGQQQAAAGHPAPPRGSVPSPPAPPPFPGDDFAGDIFPQPGPPPIFPPAGGNAFDDFSGQGAWTDPFAQPAPSGRKLHTAASGKKAGSRSLIIGGAILLVVLLAAALVFYLTRTEVEPARTPPSPPPASPQSAPAQVPPEPIDADPEKYNLHGTSFNEAYRYYNEGNYTLACDFLQDIPATSAFRERAEKLAKEMGNCTLK